MINSIKQLIYKHYKTFSLSFVVLALLAPIILSFCALSSTLVGFNLDWFLSIKYGSDRVINYLGKPYFLGNLFSLSIVNVSGDNPIVYQITNVVLYVLLIFSTYYVLLYISNNRKLSIISSIIFAYTLPVFSSLFLYESMGYLLSTITLVWLLFFLFKYIRGGNKQPFYFLIAFTTLYLLNSSFSILLIPMLTFILHKEKGNKTFLYYYLCYFVLSIAVSIPSFTNYSHYGVEYYGFSFQGLLNSFSVPFGYVYNYMVNINDLKTYETAILLINGLVLFLWAFLSIGLFILRVINNKKRGVSNHQDNLFIIFTLISLIMFILMVGLMREFSLFSLLTPLLLLFALSPMLTTKEEKIFVTKCSYISFISSLISIVVLTSSTIRIYKDENDNKYKEALEYVVSEAEKGKITIVDDTSTINKWKHVLQKNNVNNDNIKLIDYTTNNNVETEEDYNNQKTITGFKSIQPVGKGINYKGQWIVFNRFSHLFYTTDSSFTFSLYTPHYWPENHIKIYVNGNELFNKKATFCPVAEQFTYELNENAGSYVNVVIETEYAFSNYELTHTSTDRMRVCLFIAEMTAN